MPTHLAVIPRRYEEKKLGRNEKDGEKAGWCGRTTLLEGSFLPSKVKICGSLSKSFRPVPISRIRHVTGPIIMFFSLYVRICGSAECHLVLRQKGVRRRRKGSLVFERDPRDGGWREGDFSNYIFLVAGPSLHTHTHTGLFLREEVRRSAWSFNRGWDVYPRRSTAVVIPRGSLTYSVAAARCRYHVVLIAPKNRGPRSSPFIRRSDVGDHR